MKKFSNPTGFRYFLFITLVVALFLTAFQATQPAGGIPLWVWFLVVVLVILLAWYFYRSRRPAPAPTTMISQPPSTPTKADDLTLIEGIGPKIASIFQSAGITTFNQLAATDVDRLKEILEEGGIRLADPRTWAEQARLAAAGDMAGLKALQDRLTAGRDV
jgi:hypothetical protein